MEHLDKIRRHCFWNKKTEDGTKSTSLASWELVCRPKAVGGLGIVDLKIQNQGLFLKQLYKFYNKLDVPWVNLGWSSYYSVNVPHASDTCGSFWWRDVLKLMPIYRGISKANVHTGDTLLMSKEL